MASREMTGLESLEYIAITFDEMGMIPQTLTDSKNETFMDWFKNHYKKIEKALQRLEAIDNANPSEVLECLKRAKDISFGKRKFVNLEDEINCFDTIKQALQRLEAIDNSNPSEALKCLENIGELCYIETDNLDESVFMYANQCQGFDTIKQALIKAQEMEKEIDRLDDQCLDNLGEYIKLKIKSQEQEKVLEIIKEKKVDMYMLFDLGLEEYNKWILQRFGTYYQLTKEEFDLLKRYLCKNE